MSFKVCRFLFVGVMAFTLGGVVMEAQGATYGPYSSGTGLWLTIGPDEDEDEPSVENTIIVTDNFFINNMSVTLDIGHSYVSDLMIELTGPNDKTIWFRIPEWQSGGPGNPNEFELGQGYTFTDNAAIYIPTDDIVGPPKWKIPGGEYLPNDPIGNFAYFFKDSNAYGNWTLRIWDIVGPDDEGTLDSWQLNFDGTPVPIPGAVWLLGAGLAGLAGFRRNFRSYTRRH